jgi:prepilin-type N-terminal cleavage/methylation domain-containing protein
VKSYRKAFTLIELLVVIAIIAILAAILFPVFAQAKAAAKATVSLSNVKQISLGVVMYGSDADDTFPLATAWNTGNDQLTFGSGLAFSTWAWSTQPYIKSSDLFQDPLAPRNPSFTPQRNLDTFGVSFGYNATYMSPDPGTGEGPGRQSGASATSFANPSETVMLASKFAYSENTSGFSYSTAFPGGFLSDAVVDAPACYYIPNWCLNGWGKGGLYDDTYKLSAVAGAFTGGVSYRATGSSIIGWVDGHASKKKISALAAGSTWVNDNTPVGVDIIPDQKEKYVWDNE